MLLNTTDVAPPGPFPVFGQLPQHELGMRSALQGGPFIGAD